MRSRSAGPTAGIPAPRVGRRLRIAWAVVSIFLVESVVVALAAVPAVAFWTWHLRWTTLPTTLRVAFLAMASVPAYQLFALGLVLYSAAATRLLGWRTPRDVAMPLTEFGWPLLDWGRYLITIHVGESFGGALAMSFALAHPERVRALVVLNSFPHYASQLRLRAAIAGLRVMPWGAMRLVRRITEFRLHSRYTHRDEIHRFHELTAGTTQLGYRNRLRILTRYDVRDRLAALRMPVLFLAADRDHLIPSVAQAAVMAALVPGATIRVLSGHGHSCFLAHNVDLDAMLRDWLPELVGRPA
jgi:hypothetical protein